MQKWTVVVAVGALALSFADGAWAQRRAIPQQGYQQYQRGQYQQGQQQGQYQQYPQGQQQGQYQQYPQGQPRTAGRSERAAGPMQGASLSDQQIANWLLVDNRGEIQLARIAQERSSSDDVKKFAKRLIDEHAEAVEKLQPFAGMGRNTQQAAGQSNQQQGRGQYSQQAGGQSGGLNLIRLKQQLGQQCLASAQQELEQKEGAEFDKCYIGLQIAKHMEMLDTLKVFSRYASPQLDQVIEEAEQVAQDHLDKAKEMIKEHEGKGSASSSSDRSSSSSDRSSSQRDARRDRDTNRD